MTGMTSKIHLSWRSLPAVVAGLLLLITFCSGIATLRLPKDSQVEPWPTAFQSSSRHNATQDEIMPPYHILWQRRLKSVVADQPLALENYLVLTLKNGNLVILDITEGESLGEGRIAPAFEHSPTIEDNIIYFTAKLGMKTITAMNLVNKHKKWEAQLPHIYTPPLIWNDRLYAGTQDGRLFCLDRHLGEVIWHFNAKSSLYGILAGGDEHLYFCDVKGNLYALDAYSGEFLWITPLEPNAYNGPVLADKKLYMGTSSGIFYSLDSDSGEVIWQIQTGGSIYGNAAYFEGTLYFGNNAHTLYAVNAVNGEVIWVYQTGGIINTTPLVSQNYVYFGSWDNHFYILSRSSGELIQVFNLKRPIKTSPLIYRQRLFIQTANDRLFCIGNEEEFK